MKTLPSQSRSQDSEPFIALLVDIRRELKASRQFALADRIRERLKELGVKLEDRADGTSWKFERPSWTQPMRPREEVFKSSLDS